MSTKYRKGGSLRDYSCCFLSVRDQPPTEAQKVIQRVNDSYMNPRPNPLNGTRENE